MADDAGAVVVYGAVPSAFIVFHPEGPIIGLPESHSPEKTVFALAHEIGHLLMGHESRSLPHFPREIQANHWAKETLRKLLSPRLLEKVLSASMS